MNYKNYIIKKGDNELGLLWSDIKEHLLTPAQYQKFDKFMDGQTFGTIKAENGILIGLVYTEDFVKFINNQPNTD